MMMWSLSRIHLSDFCCTSVKHEEVLKSASILEKKLPYWKVVLFTRVSEHGLHFVSQISSASVQFPSPCPHCVCIQPPASEGFSHQPIPLIFEGEGWMIFTLAWVWFLSTRDTLEYCVTNSAKQSESAEGDLLWALSKHGINLVGC